MPAHNIQFGEIEGEVLVWILRPINGVNTPLFSREFILVAYKQKICTFATENIFKASNHAKQMYCSGFGHTAITLNKRENKYKPFERV